MKTGMNMLLWSDNVLDEKYLPVFESLKKMGYDGVEIPIFDPNPERYAVLGRRLDSIGLDRTVVTCSGVENNPISSDAAVRRKGGEYLTAVLDSCQALGAEVLVGPYYAALGHFTGTGPTADEWRWGLEVMTPVAEHARKLNIPLALEFLNRFEIYLLNDAAEASRFAREIGVEGCGILYDTFHAHIEEKDPAAAIRACADSLVHVHISENDRSTPGKGQVDWDASFGALKAVGYDGWLTIEAFGLALPSLTAATKIWRRMFENEETLAREGLQFMRARWGADAAGKAGTRERAAVLHS